MYRIIQDNQVVALCDRFRWVRMHDGELVGTIYHTAYGFEARVPVQDGDTYRFEKRVYALEPGSLPDAPVASLVEFHGAVDIQDKDAVVSILAGGEVDKQTATNLRASIESAVQLLPEEDALGAVALHPEWVAGVSYSAGTRVRRNGTLYTVLQAHTSQADWNPKAAPSLFAEVLIPDPNVVPEWKQPDSTNPYQPGDKVTHNGKTWECTAPNNVWEPGVYGWMEV